MQAHMITAWGEGGREGEGVKEEGEGMCGGGEREVKGKRKSEEREKKEGTRINGCEDQEKRGGREEGREGGRGVERVDRE